MGEINAQIIIGQGGVPKGGPPGDGMQAGGAVGKQPAAIGDQGIEDALLGERVGRFDQHLKQARNVLGVDGTALEFRQDPAEGGFTVGVAFRGETWRLRDRPAQITVVGEYPLLIARAAMERMAILQGHHPLGGLADVGDRAVGAKGQVGHARGDRREGRRSILPEEAHPTAIRIEAGQPPAIAVVAGGATTTGQAVKAEAQVGGGIGAEGQKFAHGSIQRLDWPNNSSHSPPLLAKNVLSTFCQPPKAATVKGLGTDAKRLLTSCHTWAFTGRKPCSAKMRWASALCR
jgi:hypothetical protein